MDYNDESDVLLLEEKQCDVSILLWIAQNCSS